MNFEEAILQEIKKQGLKDSELSLPDQKNLQLSSLVKTSLLRSWH